MKTFNPFNLKNREYLLLAACAVMMACSFDKLSLDPLIWIALFPFLLVIGEKGAKDAFKAGFFTGIAFNALAIYWLVYTISHYGKINVILSFLIFLLLVAYLALYFALFALIYSYLKKKFDSIFLAPLIWIPLEYLRAHLMSGFPWVLLGYTLYKRPTLMQFSDITGVYGQSFLIVLVNAAIYRVYLYVKSDVKKRHILVEAAISSVILASAVIYGCYALDSGIIDKDKVINVGLTQGNIDQDIKWDKDYKRETMDIYIDLTKKAVNDIPGSPTLPTLIVWPETAAPFYMQAETQLRDEILILARDTNTYLLTGGLAFESNKEEEIEDYHLYNSAFLMSPEESILGRYDKVHLVPFGEFVPLSKILFFVNKITAGIGDFSSGKTPKNLTIDDKYGYKLGILICYESIFPNLVRTFVDKGADVLVNITNDAWFGDTSAPYQQMSMAAFRAAENKRYLIRAANTGVSAIIDPFGRVTKETGIFTKTHITGKIHIVNKKTFYSEYGDIFVQALSLLLFIMIIITYKKNRKETR